MMNETLVALPAATGRSAESSRQVVVSSAESSTQHALTHKALRTHL
jgi:hypothetical protein